MSESGQGRPDSFASTLKVQRSAVGSGSGRHETARPMSQLGRLEPIDRVRANGRSPCSPLIDGPSREGLDFDESTAVDQPRSQPHHSASKGAVRIYTKSAAVRY